MNKHIETPEDPVGPKTQRSAVENSLTARSLKKMEKSSDDRMDGLINRLSNCWKQAGEAPDRMRFVAYIATLLLVVLIFANYIFLSKQERELYGADIQAQFKKTFNWMFALFACAIMLVGGAWYVTHRFDQPCDRPVPIQDKSNR